MARSRLSREERQSQIAEAALRILATEGAPQLTARHIGDAVGITDAAVFRHFADKAAILEAAIQRFEALLDDGAPPRALAPLERLRAFFVQRLGRVRAHPEILGLAFNDRLAEVAGEAGAQRVQGVIRRTVALLRSAVKEAQEQGQLRADVAPEVFVWMIQGVLRGAAATRTGAAAARSPDEIFDELLLALGAAPGAPSPSPRPPRR